MRARALLRVRDRLLRGLGDFHDVGQDQVARRRVARAREVDGVDYLPRLRFQDGDDVEVLLGRLGRRVLLLPPIQPQRLRLVAVVPGAERAVGVPKRVELVELVTLVAEAELLLGILALESHAEGRAVRLTSARPALVRGGVLDIATHHLADAALDPRAGRRLLPRGALSLTWLCRALHASFIVRVPGGAVTLAGAVSGAAALLEPK